MTVAGAGVSPFTSLLSIADQAALESFGARPLRHVIGGGEERYQLGNNEEWDLVGQSRRIDAHHRARNDAFEGLAWQAQACGADLVLGLAVEHAEFGRRHVRYMVSGTAVALPPELTLPAREGAANAPAQEHRSNAYGAARIQDEIAMFPVAAPGAGDERALPITALSGTEYALLRRGGLAPVGFFHCMVGTGLLRQRLHGVRHPREDQKRTESIGTVRNQLRDRIGRIARANGAHGLVDLRYDQAAETVDGTHIVVTTIATATAVVQTERFVVSDRIDRATGNVLGQRRAWKPPDALPDGYTLVQPLADSPGHDHVLGGSAEPVPTPPEAAPPAIDSPLPGD